MIDGNRRALIIGNCQYQDKTLQQLVTPQLDAQTLASVLEDPNIGAFKKVEVLLDKEYARLSRAIESFFVRSAHDDMLLLYFSGHGIRDELTGELYLATTDTERELLTSTTLGSGFIRRAMQNSPAHQKVLILDSCYSGAITNEMLTKGDAKVEFGREQFGSGVVILTASTALQYAFQGTHVKELREGVQSLFTRFLIKGLQTGEAALQDNPFITITDLFHYTEAQMKGIGAKQQPQITAISQQGNFVIAKSVKPRQVALPSAVLRALDNSSVIYRMAAVEDLTKLAEDEDKPLADLAVKKLQELFLVEDDFLVQSTAKDGLIKVGIQPPNVPVIRFSSGEQPQSVADWVRMAEQYWNEAVNFLYEGSLEEWLEYIEQEKLAQTAERLCKTETNRSLGLERFLRSTGLIQVQSKRDAKTNIDYLLGQLSYPALRKQKSRKTFLLALTNQGRGYLHGIVKSNAGWLEVPQPKFGCLPGQSATVEVIFNPKKFKFWRPSLKLPLDFSVE